MCVCRWYFNTNLYGRYLNVIICWSRPFTDWSCACLININVMKNDAFCKNWLSLEQMNMWVCIFLFVGVTEIVYFFHSYLGNRLWVFSYMASAETKYKCWEPYCYCVHIDPICCICEDICIRNISILRFTFFQTLCLNEIWKNKN